MNKSSNKFLGDTFLYIRKPFSNPAHGYRLKHNKKENNSKRLSGQKQSEVISNYSYFRSWRRINSATF
jgi:hypothetical protein